MRTYYFAADTLDYMKDWMKVMGLATILQHDPRYVDKTADLSGPLFSRKRYQTSKRPSNLNVSGGIVCYGVNLLSEIRFIKLRQHIFGVFSVIQINTVLIKAYEERLCSFIFAHQIFSCTVWPL